MNKSIDLGKLTSGKMVGMVEVTALGWQTRHSWGHTAEISMGAEVLARAKVRYYNRTWESYRFQSVIHIALHSYVKAVTNIDPFKKVSKRDSRPMKGESAETRRLARVEAREFASNLYHRLTGFVDGTLTYEDIAKMDARAMVA